MTPKEHRRKADLIEVITCVLLIVAIGLLFYINTRVETMQALETLTEVGVDTPAEEKPVKTAENAQNEQSAPEVEVVEIGEPMMDSELLPDPAPRYGITEEEFDLVTRVVHAEAQGEGFDGMALVAQCILNTAEATGKRPDAVVLERDPRQYADPADAASEEVIAAVEAVFIDGYQVTEEPIRFFYAPARCTSSWHENSLEYVGTWGGHRFFKVMGT